jgi:hypothetical protein
MYMNGRDDGGSSTTLKNYPHKCENKWQWASVECGCEGCRTERFYATLRKALKEGEEE